MNVFDQKYVAFAVLMGQEVIISDRSAQDIRDTGDHKFSFAEAISGVYFVKVIDFNNDQYIFAFVCPAALEHV